MQILKLLHVHSMWFHFIQLLSGNSEINCEKKVIFTDIIVR